MEGKGRRIDSLASYRLNDDKYCTVAEEIPQSPHLEGPGLLILGRHLDLVAKLAALVPPPWFYLARYNQRAGGHQGNSKLFESGNPYGEDFTR